jgi:hypothetical protein
VSDDRAIEVLDEGLKRVDRRDDFGRAIRWQDLTRQELAEVAVEALASAGFQITDLTADEATRCVAALDSERAYLGADVVGYNDDLKAKLRRLSGANGG